MDPSVVLLNAFRNRIAVGFDKDSSYAYAKELFPLEFNEIHLRSFLYGHLTGMPGDVFQCRHELVLLGHHRSIQSGVSIGEVGSAACIVARYQNHNYPGLPNTFIIGGSGGRIKEANRIGQRILEPQHLTIYNLALRDSIRTGLPVRLYSFLNNQMYRYFGLIRIVAERMVETPEHLECFEYLVVPFNGNIPPVPELPPEEILLPIPEPDVLALEWEEPEEPEFFEAKPLACDQSSLPKYPPSKEFDAKRRDEEQKRRKAESVKGRGPESVRRGHRESKGIDPTPEFISHGQQVQSDKCASVMYNPRGDAGSGFPIDPPKGLTKKGISHSNSMVHLSAAASWSSKVKDESGMTGSGKMHGSSRHGPNLKRQRSHGPQSASESSNFHKNGTDSSNDNMFFKAKPLPCDPSSLPKYPPSKEFDAKRRDEEQKRRKADSVKGRGPESVRRGHRESKGIDPTPEFISHGQQVQSNKCASVMYNPRGDAGSGFPIVIARRKRSRCVYMAPHQVHSPVVLT